MIFSSNYLSRAGRTPQSLQVSVGTEQFDPWGPAVPPNSSSRTCSWRSNTHHVGFNTGPNTRLENAALNSAWKYSARSQQNHALWCLPRKVAPSPEACHSTSDPSLGNTLTPSKGAATHSGTSLHRDNVGAPGRVTTHRLTRQKVPSGPGSPNGPQDPSFHRWQCRATQESVISDGHHLRRAGLQTWTVIVTAQDKSFLLSLHPTPIFSCLCTPVTPSDPALPQHRPCWEPGTGQASGLEATSACRGGDPTAQDMTQIQWQGCHLKKLQILNAYPHKFTYRIWQAPLLPGPSAGTETCWLQGDST